jgi:hypothetical protein
MSEFSKLSPQAREIAHELMMVADGDLNRLVRLLDADMDFRKAIGVTNMDVYPHQVDYVVRFYQTESVK